MKTFIFVRNKTYRPSTYYRLIQYLEDLQLKNNVEICEYESNKYYTNSRNKTIQKFSYGLLIGYIRRIVFLLKIILFNESYQIFIQREIFPRNVEFIGKKLTEMVIANATNIYWDFDDQIVVAKEISSWEFELLSSKSTEIFVGNQNLKNLIKIKYHDKVKIINTTDKCFENFDFEVTFKKRKRSYNEKVSLVWLGTKANIHYLQEILPAIEDASMEVDKQIEINIVSNSEIVPTKESKLIINNIPWTRDIALQQLRLSHIGLMPLEDSEITRGKCSFKAIQYMGAGLPIIISPVGMNKEIIDGNGYFASNNEQWKESLIDIIKNKKKWEVFSEKSFEIWTEKYNSETIGKEISRKILEVKF
ncbi:MAG: glycosyltransferase [Culicoidibacterales bacterium]